MSVRVARACKGRLIEHSPQFKGKGTWIFLGVNEVALGSGHLLPGGDDSPTLTRQLPTAGDAKLLAISFDARQREKVHSRAPLCTGWLHSAHVPGVYLGEEGLTYWDRSGRLAAFMYSRLVLVLGASNDIVSSSFSAILFLKRHLHATSVMLEAKVTRKPRSRLSQFGMFG